MIIFQISLLDYTNIALSAPTSALFVEIGSLKALLLNESGHATSMLADFN